MRRDFALSASFVLECFDGSEVTTREGNELVVQKENCVVEEIKEVELRSRRGKFIYNRTYNSVGLNKISHFSRRGRAPSRLPLKKLKSLLQKTRKVRVFVWKGIRKNTPLSSKIHCYVNNGNALDVNRYSSSCKSVRFLKRTSRKLVRKRGKVCLSSKHQRRGDLSSIRYANRVLSKYLSLCTCNYPFYSAYKSLNHLVNFEQVKLSSDIEKNPGPPVFVDATKTIHAPYCQGNVVVFGGNAGQQCVAMSLCALIYSKIRMITSVDDMIQIMTVGNELYSSLSLLARQSMLMFTELPVMVTVFERFFPLQYSESYTCNMNGDARIEGITTVCHWVQHWKHSWL